MLSKAIILPLQRLFSMQSFHILTFNAPVFRRSNLADVQRNDHGGAADTEADNESSGAHLGHIEGRCLNHGSGDEKETTEVNAKLAAVFQPCQPGCTNDRVGSLTLVRSHASNNSANKSSAGGQ